MKFQHDNSLIEKYPNNFTFALSVRGVKDKTVIDTFSKELADKISIKQIDDVVVPQIFLWRQIIKEMGANVDKILSSIESLANNYKKTGHVYQINPIVDLYNRYSLLHGIPMAAYDIDKISGDISLGVVGKGKQFTPLDNPKNMALTKSGEIAYFDNEKVICRYWNYQDCSQTKITNNTENILFFFDQIIDDEDNVMSCYEKCCSDFSKMFSGCEINGGITGKNVGNVIVFS